MPAPVRYHRAPGWVWRVVPGTVLAMGPDAEARRLSGAAAAVWVALDGPSTAGEVVDRTAPGPDVPPDAALALAQDALALLVDLGGVVVVDGTPP